MSFPAFPFTASLTEFFHAVFLEGSIHRVANRLLLLLSIRDIRSLIRFQHFSLQSLFVAPINSLIPASFTQSLASITLRSHSPLFLYTNSSCCNSFDPLSAIAYCFRTFLVITHVSEHKLQKSWAIKLDGNNSFLLVSVCACVVACVPKCRLFRFYYLWYASVIGLSGVSRRRRWNFRRCGTTEVKK